MGGSMTNWPDVAMVAVTILGAALILWIIIKD